MQLLPMEVGAYLLEYCDDADLRLMKGVSRLWRDLAERELELRAQAIAEKLIGNYGTCLACGHKEEASSFDTCTGREIKTAVGRLSSMTPDQRQLLDQVWFSAEKAALPEGACSIFHRQVLGLLEPHLEGFAPLAHGKLLEWRALVGYEPRGCSVIVEVVAKVFGRLLAHQSVCLEHLLSADFT